MRSAAFQSWEDTEHFRDWLRLARRNNQNNMSEKENPPNFIPTESEPTPEPIWPGDDLQKPGTVVPGPQPGETTIIPIVR